ncbi:MAG TPA: flagellar filament outer layer protein FlaA [Spirochaetia bacterium]|nr:flagellar filament outer layer protein FlaA [Spirochaetia bacterium]
MTPGLRAFLAAALTFMLLFTAVSVMAQESVVTLQVRPLISFDDQGKMANWIVQGSKFAAQGFPEAKLVKAWPDALYGRNKDNRDLNSLAIHSKFDRKGYNYIEIIPATKDSSGNLVPTTIPIPGKVQRMDMWVWGSNYNYTMDVFLRDFRGIDHVLHFGSLNFAGWRDLSVNVPGSIPQARRYLPQFQAVELTKVVIWTAPDEKVDDAWIFLDELTILTDMGRLRFDGEDLADPDYLNQLWQQASK